MDPYKSLRLLHPFTKKVTAISTKASFENVWKRRAGLYYRVILSLFRALLDDFPEHSPGIKDFTVLPRLLASAPVPSGDKQVGAAET